MRLVERFALCWRILTAKTGNTLAHTEQELGASARDWVGTALRELVLVFGTQGHSGMSAAFVREALAKLLAFEPLGPLTGEPDEWVEVGPGVYQNRRCGRVFKQADRFNGQAYDIDGRVFREPSGVCFTSSESLVPVTFPYTPTTVYVDVEAVTPA